MAHLNAQAGGADKELRYIQSCHAHDTDSSACHHSQLVLLPVSPRSEVLQG